MRKVVKQTIKLSLLLALGGGLLSGCGAPPAPKVKVYWPPPPADPKMEWITSFHSEDNFPKSEGQKFTEKMLGKDIKHFLKKPMSVVSDSNGVVYIADMEAGTVFTVDFDARKMAPYKQGARLGDLTGTAIDSQDNLYIADVFAKEIVVYRSNRAPLRTIGKGELIKPTFLALNESLGRLYVSDILRHEVVVFDVNSGEKLFAFGGKGGAKGELYGPQGVAIDAEGRVFVAEQFNARVQVFDADGNHLSMFGSRGDRDFQFEGPRGMAFDSEGNLYVAEARKAAVLIFTPEGDPLSFLGVGSRSVHQLGFTLPTSVFIDKKDRIYISDGMNKRVTIWQKLTPAYLAENPLDQEVLDALEKKVMQIVNEKEKKK